MNTTTNSRFHFQQKYWQLLQYLLFLCCFFFYHLVSFLLILGHHLKPNEPHFDRLNHSTNCWSFPNFSAAAMTCSQIFVLLSIQLLSKTFLSQKRHKKMQFATQDPSVAADFFKTKSLFLTKDLAFSNILSRTPNRLFLKDCIQTQGF